MWFSKEIFLKMVSSGWIVDGRGGGLVIGRSHAEGNIAVVQEQPDGTFHIRAYMEGGEYILNHEAVKGNEERVEQINSETGLHETTPILEITPKTRTLNTHSEPCDKMLWIDSRSQYIVCKSATAKHLQELETINHAVNGFVSCDLNNLILKVGL